MKWALAQLNRYNGKPFEFEETIDLSDYLNIDSDIKRISPVHVKGKGLQLQDDHYEFSYHIDCVCVLECSVTLDEFDYVIDLDVVEEYDTVEHEDAFLIEGQTIDLDDAVWQNIYLSIPMRIVKEEYLAQNK